MGLESYVRKGMLPIALVGALFGGLEAKAQEAPATEIQGKQKKHDGCFDELYGKLEAIDLEAYRKGDKNKELIDATAPIAEGFAEYTFDDIEHEKKFKVSDLMNELGLAYLRNKEYEKAFETFIEATRIDQENAGPYCNAGSIMLNVYKNKSEAAKLFRLFIEKKDDKEDPVYKSVHNWLTKEGYLTEEKVSTK